MTEQVQRVFEYTIPEGMDEASVNYGMDIAIQAIRHELNSEGKKVGYWMPKNMKYVNGRPKPDMWTTYECSECHKTSGRGQSNFCKHCGALMIRVRV